MGDLVRVRIFSQTFGDRIFPRTYKAIVWQVFPCKTFLCLKSDFKVFFLKSPIPPPALKSQMVGPL